MREIPGEARELSDLIELQVSNNLLYEIPGDLIARFEKLERLGCAGERKVFQ